MANIFIEGRLTRDIELKYTQSGQAMARFSIAHNDRIRNRETGEWEDGEAQFWDCTLWGRKAEAAAAKHSKGAPIMVFGDMKPRTWEKNGDKRTSWEVTVREIGATTLPAPREGSTGGFNSTNNQQSGDLWNSQPPQQQFGNNDEPAPF